RSGGRAGRPRSPRGGGGARGGPTRAGAGGGVGRRSCRRSPRKGRVRGRGAGPRGRGQPRSESSRVGPGLFCDHCSGFVLPRLRNIPLPALAVAAVVLMGTALALVFF